MKKITDKKLMEMAKPMKPIEPVFNRKKYPYPPTKEGRNHLNEPVYLPNADWLRDYRKWQKDSAKYIIDMELYEQIKSIKLIKVANLNLCLKKFKITKR